MAGNDKAIELDVAFGSANFGKTVASLGVKISRDKLKVTQADKLFCDSRLQVSLEVEDDPDQTWFDGMKPGPLTSVVDVKGFSTNAEQFSASMAFSIQEISSAQILKFRHRDGKLTLTRIGAIPKDDAEGQMKLGDADGAEAA